METSDGDRIYATDSGIRSGTAEDIRKLVTGGQSPDEVGLEIFTIN